MRSNCGRSIIFYSILIATKNKIPFIIREGLRLNPKHRFGAYIHVQSLGRNIISLCVLEHLVPYIIFFLDIIMSLLYVWEPIIPRLLPRRHHECWLNRISKICLYFYRGKHIFSLVPLFLLVI